MSLVGDEGTFVRGSFALFYPEVQTVTLSSEHEVTVGGYKLAFNHSKSTKDGLVQVQKRTACLRWDATAEEVSGRHLFRPTWRTTPPHPL